jgi:hypothetical protein
MPLPPTLPRQAEAEEAKQLVPEVKQVAPEVRLVVEAAEVRRPLLREAATFPWETEDGVPALRRTLNVVPQPARTAAQAPTIVARPANTPSHPVRAVVLRRRQESAPASLLAVLQRFTSTQKAMSVTMSLGVSHRLDKACEIAGAGEDWRTMKERKTEWHIDRRRRIKMGSGDS